MNTIQPLTTPSLGPVQSPGATTGASTDGKSFKDYLLDSIHEVNSMQQSADQAVEKLVTGGDVSPAEVLTAVQKADVDFRMMMQIRNKIMSAYDEVKNIRV
jgi:flagellar hook-basal body complex protein FliE